MHNHNLQRKFARESSIADCYFFVIISTNQAARQSKFEDYHHNILQNPKPCKVYNSIMPDTWVIKCNAWGEEVWRYPACVLRQSAGEVVVEAIFNRPDLPFHGVTLKNGDRFVETFSTTLWFNIFEVHDREDDALKCWYCNVTYPAKIQPGVISYNDLALDMLVFPGGGWLVLDEDEFTELGLAPNVKTQALEALEQLKEWANRQLLD
jgi:hypothetical protein